MGHKTEVAQRLLADASKSLVSAVQNGDMVGIKAATEMVEMAKANMDVINAEREEQAKMRARLGQKRRNTLENFVLKIKKV